MSVFNHECFGRNENWRENASVFMRERRPGKRSIRVCVNETDG